MKKVLSGKSVLIVDDEPDMLNLLEESLIFFGATTYRSANGEEALKQYQIYKIDLIISDIRMPELTGAELLEELRKVNKTTPPIVLITGYADLSPEQAFQMGSDAFLMKPFSIEKLFEVVSEALTPPGEKWKQNNFTSEPAFTIQRIQHDFDDLINSSQVRFGRGGFFLKLENSFPRVNDLAEFCFEFSPNRRFLGVASCMWVRESSTSGTVSGAGFEFKYIPEASREIFNEIYQRVKHESYIPNHLDLKLN